MHSILDVTLRDGGYVNGHSFSLEESRGIVRHLNAARIPFIEVGYFRTVNPSYRGRRGTAVCDPEYLDAMREVSQTSQLAVMVRPGDILPEHVGRLAASGVSLVRFPVLAGKLGEVRPYVEAVRAEGMLTAVSIIRSSELPLDDILRAGEFIQEVGADWLYVADSNGSLLPSEVAKIFAALAGRVETRLGLHPHDGLSLAFANTLEACRAGAQLVDASLGGMGKNGNLCTELVSMYFNLYYGTRYDIRSLTEATRLFIAKTIGDGCLLRNEYAAASILNLNLEKLNEFTKTSEREGRPVFDLLLDEIQARALGAKEKGYGRVPQHFGRHDSQPQEDDQPVVSDHFGGQGS